MNKSIELIKSILYNVYMNEVTWFIRNDPLSGEYMYVIHSGIPYYCSHIEEIHESILSLSTIRKCFNITNQLELYKNENRYIKLLLYIRKIDSKLYQELIK